MSTEPRVWVLNLDAESELEAPRNYVPTAHLRAIVSAKQRLLRATLVQPGDLVLAESEHGPSPAECLSAQGLKGHAWSPTPRALQRLRAAGARLPATPALEVLQRVNARPFAALVRTPLAAQSFCKHIVAELEQSLQQLAQPAPLGWLVRRTFGAAGRGRRRIKCGKPAAHELQWLQASLRLGPLVIEPWVEVMQEYTRSALVTASGVVQISGPCFQATTEQGAWTHTARAHAGELGRADDRQLEEAVAAAGAALAAAGYSGPFGIDAFRHRALDGSAHSVLNPLSEINARFTMDWATAFGEKARDYLGY